MAEERRQVQAAADFHRLIRLIAREMRNTQADLDQVLARAAKGCPLLFQKEQRYDRAEMEQRLKASLPQEAHQLAAALFEELGKSALLSQLDSLERFAAEAQELHASCRTAHLERRKLVMTLSVLTGLLLAILLY